MILKFLKELRAQVTEDEFNEVLNIATQDIKFNQVGFNKLTKAKKFIEICMSSLIAIQNKGSEEYGQVTTAPREVYSCH